jgi:ATP-dependent helicase HrpA
MSGSPFTLGFVKCSPCAIRQSKARRSVRNICHAAQRSRESWDATLATLQASQHLRAVPYQGLTPPATQTSKCLARGYVAIEGSVVLEDLEARLARCTLEDADALQRRATRLFASRQRRSGADTDARSGGMAQRWQQFEQVLSTAEALFEARRRSVPAAPVLAHLPIAASAASITTAIAQHQIIIVSGDTGSGKSTQLAKLCLQAGRGVAGQIAHTQPRRVAARNIARRVAHELGQVLGESIGFKVRFDSRVRRESHVKVMTDGLLLAELGRDRQLRAYDTVIVDEAHERSLNIDFLLGYLKRLCRARPELRVVISSATLDEARFSAFFNDAPIIQVSGRSYPVEVRYRPLADDALGEDTLAEQVRSSVAELCQEGAGDVLVFLSGEREIHDVAGRLRHAFGTSLDVLPLYARLPTAKQERIFAAHTRRRVVLATNVAETSLTVPGVRYVVDAGRARVGRHRPGSAVQHLLVEYISKASAHQRAGRCGREADGVCIRLYSQQAYETFAEFVEPEILRTNLAAVLLRMRTLGVRDLRQFPLLDAPRQRYVNDGLRLLRELGALDTANHLTTLGRQLARLPLEPRVGRMLLAAAEHDCVAEMLIIASGLAAGDPRERSRAQRGPMAQHLRFEDERSDFLRLVKIWKYVHGNTRGGASGSVAQVCRRARLSFSRMQQWREIHLQLSIAAREIGLKSNTQTASYANVHRALLSGLLRHVGSRLNEREFRGIRGNHFRVSGGSGQAGRRVRWVLAAELVDAGTTFAHTVAVVRPEWVEQAAGTLMRRTHFDAWWDTCRAQAMVYEQTSLYALTVTARRAISFASVSQQGAREVFIRGAVVDARYRSEAPVFKDAWRWMAQRRELEAKLRRPDPAINQERLYQFFEENLPKEIFDAPSFEAWWPQADDAQVRRLSLPNSLRSLTGAQAHLVESGIQSTEASHDLDANPDDVNRGEAIRGDELAEMGRNYPDEIALPNATVPLRYEFAPGQEHDGITLTVPRMLLAGVRETDVEFAVPGLRRDRALAMLRALPKSMRRRIGPAADALRRYLHREQSNEESSPTSLARFLSSQYAVEVDVDFWERADAQARIPEHLRIRYRVLDSEGELLACSRNLDSLQRQYTRLHDEKPDTQRDASANQTHWTFGRLPERLQVQHDGASGWVFPALLGGYEGVVVSHLDNEERARATHRRGLLRLAISVCEVDIERLSKGGDDADRLCLLNTLVSPGIATAPAGEALVRPARKERGPCAQLLHDIVVAGVARAFESEKHWAVRDDEAFAQYCRAGSAKIQSSIDAQRAEVGVVLELHRAVLGLLNEHWPQAYNESLTDARTQLSALVHYGFLVSTSARNQEQLPRYLNALQLRLQKLRTGGAHDAQKLQQLVPHWSRYEARARAHARRGRRDDTLLSYRWLLEEYRISLFAQELGTQQKVSKQRLDRLWANVPP